MSESLQKGRPRRLWWIGILVIAAGTVCVLWLYYRYSAFRFRGDATITDRGQLSYPRYCIEFPVVSLNSPGRWTWNVEGLPPVPWTLQLQIQGTGDYEELQKVSTYVECVLRDQEGKV